MQKLITPLFFLFATLFSVVANAEPMLRPFEPDSLARMIEEQNGKPFVLVVWSLDCEYCQTSLKTLAQEQRKRKDLTVVTLSTDTVSDPEAVTQMQKRLASLGMTGKAWAYGTAPSEQLRFAIDPKWHGEKPRSYWFNARGERMAYSGVLTSAMISKFMSR